MTYEPKAADWRPDIENAALLEADRRWPASPLWAVVKAAFVAGALWGAIEKLDQPTLIGPPSDFD